MLHIIVYIYIRQNPKPFDLASTIIIPVIVPEFHICANSLTTFTMIVDQVRHTSNTSFAKNRIPKHDHGLISYSIYGSIKCTITLIGKSSIRTNKSVRANKIKSNTIRRYNFAVNESKMVFMIMRDYILKARWKCVYCYWAMLKQKQWTLMVFICSGIKKQWK